MSDWFCFSPGTSVVVAVFIFQLGLLMGLNLGRILFLFFFLGEDKFALVWMCPTFLASNLNSQFNHQVGSSSRVFNWWKLQIQLVLNPCYARIVVFSFKHTPVASGFKVNNGILWWQCYSDLAKHGTCSIVEHVSLPEFKMLEVFGTWYHLVPWHLQMFRFLSSVLKSHLLERF